MLGRLIGVAAIALVLYIVIQQPTESANRLDEAASEAGDAAAGAVSFLTALDGSTIAIILLLAFAAAIVFRR